MAEFKDGIKVEVTTQENTTDTMTEALTAALLKDCGLDDSAYLDAFGPQLHAYANNMATGVLCTSYSLARARTMLKAFHSWHVFRDGGF